MRYLTCSFLTIVFLFTAAHAQDDAAKKDLAKLQGVWQVVSMRIEGKDFPEEALKTMKLTFKGNKGSHPAGDGKKKEAIIKLDPSKKPKAIDMSPLSESEKGTTLLGIYSIKGNTLRMCIARPGRDRPTEFKAGKKVNLMLLKRVKQ